MEMKLTIKLGDEAMKNLMKPIRGEGGFQTLMRRLQKRLRESLKSHEVWVTPEEIVRVHRYTTKTGQGGFQGRLSPVVGAIKEFGDVWVEIYGN